MGGPGTTLEVLLKQQQGALVWLRMGAGPLFWRMRALLVELFDIALDRRADNVEPTGGLALLEMPFFWGLHYLFAKGYRIGCQLTTMPGVATSLHGAVGVQNGKYRRP